MSFRGLAALVIVGALSTLVLAQAPAPAPKPLFDTSAFRPQVALYPLPMVTPNAFVTVSGVIFSRAPIDRVTVGDRTAALRQAEPKDLVRLERAPQGASDAPFRTYFEVPDAGLARSGANEVEVRAHGSDGRVSDVHRLTIVRSITSSTTTAAARP
jgi:hypothetical protein